MLKLEKSQSYYPQQFQTTHVKLAQALPTAEIHHVGSTAIPGLGGKGIIDILVAVPNWKEKATAIDQLKALGYTHIHPEENSRIFMSRVGATQAGDVHLHLTFLGSSQYRSLLSFRDFLLANPEKAKEYGDRKPQWLARAKGNRRTYAKLKSTWIGKLKRTERSSLKD